MKENAYFKRKIYDKLLEWKKRSSGNTALLVEGAKQIGKTTIVKEFAKNEYKDYILIDFNVASDEIKNLFIKQRDDIDLLLEKLQLYYRKILKPQESLIIFDEVQFCPEARSLIKYLVADGRYDYIETGSLISIKKNVENIIIPSEEEKINMYPFDFEEFLWALGDYVTIPFLKECFLKKSKVDIAHKRIMQDFRTYILTGGMPQAIVEYANSKSFEKIDNIKRTILRLYYEDINKADNCSKILSIYENIPGQLSNASKKFKFSSIDKNARYQNYQEELIWLDEAKLINLCKGLCKKKVTLFG